MQIDFFALNVAAKYDLNALSFIGETGWFDPYLQFGLGGTWIDSDAAFTIKLGRGFNTWIHENVGLNFDSSFNYGVSEFSAVSASNYFQHSLGLIIRFNGNE